MKNILTYLVIVLITAGILLYFVFGQQAKENNALIKIGIIASLTGKGAVRGESAVQGLELALETIKANNTLKGHDIELVYQDVPFDQIRNGPSAFNYLVDFENVVAVIGPMSSNVSLSVTPLVDGKKIPTIIHTASVRSATEGNEFVFRLWPTAQNYADAIIEELKKRNYTRIAVISAQSENTADLLKLFLSEVANISGITVVSEQEVSVDTNDFRTQLAKIKPANPDALFINLFEGQIGVAAKQARETGITVPFFTGSVTSDIELEVGPEYLEGAWFPQFAGYREDTRETFIERLGNEPPNPDTAAAAHDALLIIIEAISKVGTDGEKIKDYLYNNELRGSIGTFRFYNSGDADVPINLWVVRDGKIVELE